MAKQKHLLVFLSLIITLSSFAQEVVTPLLLNAPQAIPAKSEKKLTKKNGIVFPLVDHFLRNGSTDTLVWEKGNTSVLNRKVIFNAIDSNGLSYSSAGLTDVLESKKGLLIDKGVDLFLSFTIAAGITHQNSDSLLVYGLNRKGVWTLIWQNPVNFSSASEIVIGLNPKEFASENFALRFESYTNWVQTSNTNSFELSKLALSYKWPLYTYNHFNQFQGRDSTVEWDYYSGPDVRVIKDTISNYSFGNVAFFDVKNFSGVVYDNASNLFGSADTLWTNPMDISQYEEADSIILSFLLKSGADNQINDSFIVEFKNNLGVWVPVLLRNGIQNPQFLNHQFIVNSGRFRHANFQARFIFKSTYSNLNPAHWMLSGLKLVKRIQLPFFDDFSGDRVSVNKARWQDNWVFVNNDFPVNHPSINVATFDGLDPFGNPYSSFPVKGICDRLTTHSMSLRGLQLQDSVLLSFYFQYEPQGTTNQVYPDDSLIIEFKSSAFSKDSFEIITMISANDTFLNTFTYFEYMIANSKFFHDDFQIRLKNKGSMSGNLSHWHVDYVRFNKGRLRNDPLKDMSLTNTPRLYLGEYTSMPWYQYLKNPAKYGFLPDQLRIVNHDNQAYAVDYFRNIVKPEGDTLDRFNNILPTILPFSDSVITISKPFNFQTAVQADSLVFQTQYRLKISGNQNDNVTTNDTFTTPTIFSNYYAYDDGTAEGGYGVRLKSNVGANLKYKLEEPDSVVGVYIFFNQSEQNVSTQRFQLKLWKSISPLGQPATQDVPIYTQDISRPTYTNTINGFTSYRFVEPIPVQDSFYIGWEQTNSFVLNVGLDKNYRFGVNPNMAYKMDGRWYASEIEGALMIRPIMRKFIGSATFLSEPTKKESIVFNLYPNPAENYFEVDLPHLQDYKIELINLQGARVKTLEAYDSRVDILGVESGFYFVSFENQKTQQKFAKKLLIK
ncbi:MAG: T9SS type A sorting domain-containing protein [Bacteroidia bacterium]|nr:T9SS type A sorting domain-containing protein [Bacteroidia bacterium]